LPLRIRRQANRHLPLAAAAPGVVPAWRLDTATVARRSHPTSQRGPGAPAATGARRSARSDATPPTPRAVVVFRAGLSDPLRATPIGPAVECRNVAALSTRSAILP